MNPIPSSFHMIPEDFWGISQVIDSPYSPCLQPQPCTSYESTQSPGEAIASAFSVLNQDHSHSLVTPEDSSLSQKEDAEPIVGTICAPRSPVRDTIDTLGISTQPVRISATNIPSMSYNDLIVHMAEIVFSNPVPLPVNYPPITPYQLCGGMHCRQGRKRFPLPLVSAINKSLLSKMQREFYLAQKVMSPFQKRLAKAMEKKRPPDNTLFPNVYIRRTCGEKYLLDWNKLEKALHRLIIWSSEKKAAYALNPIPSLRAIQWLRHFFSYCPLARPITGAELVESCTCAIIAQKVVIAIEHLSALYPTNDQFSFLNKEDLELTLSSPDRIVQEKAVVFLIS